MLLLLEYGVLKFNWGKHMNIGINMIKRVVCGMVCCLVTLPAIAAAPVRNLGGAGTYPSVTSATVSKVSGGVSGTQKAVAATKSVTAQSPNITKPGVSRAVSTPRLSLGKYVPHRVVSSSGVAAGGAGFVGKEEWEEDYKELPVKVSELEVAINILEEAVKDGVLSEADIQDLRDTVDAIVAQMPADGKLAASQDDVTELQNQVAQIDENKVDVSADAVQTMAGTYVVSGQLDVPTQALPAAE